MTNSIDTWKAAVTANGVLRRAFFFFFSTVEWQWYHDNRINKMIMTELSHITERFKYYS